MQTALEIICCSELESLAMYYNYKLNKNNPQSTLQPYLGSSPFFWFEYSFVKDRSSLEYWFLHLF